MILLIFSEIPKEILEFTVDFRRNSEGNEAGEAQGKPRAAQIIDCPLIIAGIPKGI